MIFSLLNTGLTAICQYAQSNDTQVSVGYIDIGRKAYNTATDTFEYNSKGILVKQSGIYAIECHYHVLAEANDIINLIFEYATSSKSKQISKILCVPITCQITDQIISIIKVDVETRVLIKIRSEGNKSYAFSAGQSSDNYIIVKKLA